MTAIIYDPAKGPLPQQLPGEPIDDYFARLHRLGISVNRNIPNPPLAVTESLPQKEDASKGSSMETYPTGAKRENKAGKGRFDLIPYSALRRVALVYEKGREAHGDRNWEKGLPISSCFSSAIRHTLQALDYMRRPATHPVEDHLAHAVFNLLAIMTFQEDGPRDSTVFDVRRPT